jgi:hypothetical protein
MRAITTVVLCLAIGGCGLTPEQRVQQERSQFDNDKCESYGTRKGEPAYAQCRAQLDASRTGAAAAAAKSTPAPMVIVNSR